MSQLPSWMIQHQRAVEARKRRVQTLAAQQLAYSFQPRVDFHTAPGWREVGMYFTMAEHPMFVKDPDVTRAIQKFDPGVVPLGVYWVFRSPEDCENPHEEVFFRHVVARYNPEPKNELTRFRVEGIPVWFKGEVPNQIEYICEGERDPKIPDLPGRYEPWDWKLYYKLRAAYTYDLEVREQQRRVRKIAEDAQIRKQKLAEEMAYRQADVESYINRKLENASEQEMKEFALHGIEKAGPKLFTDLGGKKK
jgi:hypothetical protein